MAQINKLSDCYGLISNALGFESIESQKLTINSFAENHGFKVVNFINMNDLSSPTLENFIKAIINKKPGVVICSELALLPSSIKSLESLLLVLSKLNTMKITFISVLDWIDTDNNTESFLANLYSAWINFKKSRKIANAKASSSKAKSRNHPLGRKKVRNDAEIRRLRKQGLTIREIAAKVGLSTTAVQKGLEHLPTTPNDDIGLQP
ncbi:MAG: hypothetical protein H7235_01655 [Bdellovibrionaceae bacterium]|nr:hypothetical protein [Pseudobdellovibrionaceae bacterium]